MAWRFYEWAWKTSVQRSSDRLVLLALAELSNSESAKCWPSVETICEMTSMNRKTVLSVLGRLESIGVIYVQKRQGVANLYTLAVPKTVPVPEAGQVPKTVRGVSQKRDDTSTKNGTEPVPKTGHRTSKEPIKEPVNEPISRLTFEPEKPKRKRRTPPAKPQELTDQTWKDWNAQRNAKHAPISETVVKKFRAEAEKAGISLEEAVQYSIFRGWQGFQADWYLKNLAKEKAISTNRPLQREDMAYTDDF